MAATARSPRSATKAAAQARERERKKSIRKVAAPNRPVLRFSAGSARGVSRALWGFISERLNTSGVEGPGHPVGSTLGHDDVGVVGEPVDGGHRETFGKIESKRAGCRFEVRIKERRS
jgi:hypothetical protein